MNDISMIYKKGKFEISYIKLENFKGDFFKYNWI